MKTGKELAVLIVLLLIAGTIWMWERGQNPVVAKALSIASNYSPMNVDNLTLHTAERDMARKSEYKGTGRNPFSAVPPPPPVLKPGDKGYVAPPPAPPPPPPVAQLPPSMKFFGYGTVPNGAARRAYLSDGEEVYIVAEGDTLLGKFRIVRIGSATLEFEDLSLHVQGQKNLEELAPVSAAPGT